MAVFRFPLDIVIKDRPGLWRFTAAVLGACLGLTFAVTIVSDYFEGYSLSIMAIDLCISTLDVAVLALPLAYFGARSNLALYQAKCEAERCSLTDSLTGLMNRRAFIQTLEQAGGAEQALVIFDLDRFKRINDVHGHQAGDFVIRRVADALQAALGGLGKVARVGGEEFALLAPPSVYDTLIVKLIELRARIEEMAIAIDGATIGTTISAGVALGAPGESIVSLYRRADQALYEAKAAGRNCLRFDAGGEAVKAVEGGNAARSA